MPHILIVEDDAHIRDVICFALTKAGYTYETVTDGKRAILQFEASPVDLVILDIGLPEIDGLEVCRRIRRTSNVPILFLSARNDEIDRVLGLEIGGDDYVTKPFSPRELIARITVILRRVNNSRELTTEGNQTFTKGMVQIDVDHRSVKVSKEIVQLTAIEFNIMQSLMARPKMAFTRAQIMAQAYDGNIHVSDRTIDSHIRNIRAKFSSLGCHNTIETVHGVGFRLGACGAPT